MKTCSVCGVSKDDSCFGKRRGQCKPCRQRLYHIRITTNPESKRKFRETERRKHARQRERHLEEQRRYYKANRAWFQARGRAMAHSPEIKASALVRTAVRRGELVRPETCPACGHSGRIEGHHNDYTKPLEVTWVCRGCHAAIHRRLRDEGASA